MTRMMSMLPGMGDLSKMLSNTDAEGEMGRKVAIIDSMTAKEKKTPKIIDQSRRNRIARGAGVQVQDVNQLVKEYDPMGPTSGFFAGPGWPASALPSLSRPCSS